MIGTRGRVSFGIKTSQVSSTYDEILAVWREADGGTIFDDAWLWDHLVPLRGDVTQPALEAWTLLAALAATTERLRLGVIVTSNRLRSPAILAKMAATVDQISHGRLVLGIGSGGSAVADPVALALVHRELDAFGIDVVSAGEAVGALGEAVSIIRRLWRETDPIDVEGRYYRLRGAICEPKPVQHPAPRIMVAAGAERGLRIVAEAGDAWVWPGDLDGFIARSTRLDELCVERNRDPAEITRTVQVLVRGDATALERTRDATRAFIEAGATHIVLGAVPPYGGSAVRFLANEVVQPVLAAIS